MAMRSPGTTTSPVRTSSCGMGVARRQAVAVIDLDHPAEVALEAGEDDDAARRRGDRRACAPAKSRPAWKACE